MAASNGVGQGCPWSIDDIAVIMSAWARRMARVVPRALCAVYVDDNSLTVEGEDAPEVLGSSAGEIERFDTLTGQL
eukprot:11366646-Alexandrium_andersonii.AAC.1